MKSTQIQASIKRSEENPLSEPSTEWNEERETKRSREKKSEMKALLVRGKTRERDEKWQR